MGWSHMLAYLETARLHEPLFRYVGCDAGPRCNQSYEVFVAAEMVIRRQAVGGCTSAFVSPCAALWWLLPLATFGHGRASRTKWRPGSAKFGFTMPHRLPMCGRQAWV